MFGAFILGFVGGIFQLVGVLLIGVGLYSLVFDQTLETLILLSLLGFGAYVTGSYWKYQSNHTTQIKS